jgi:hypothetical protein
MSISSATEKLLIVCEAAKIVPSNRPGQRVSSYSMNRWITLGARLRGGGRLKLRAVYSPGGWLTCEAWIHEFLEALTADRNGVAAPPPDAERRAAEAEARLKAREAAGKKAKKTPASKPTKARRSS